MIEKKSKTRNTQQKQIISDYLKDNKSHPTASEVYEAVTAINPKISQSTTYRNLNAMADDGEIVRLLMPIGPDHYDSMVEHHYHFLCKQCKSVLDVEMPYNEKLNDISFEGCSIEWHKLIFVGLCDECGGKK